MHDKGVLFVGIGAVCLASPFCITFALTTYGPFPIVFPSTEKGAMHPPLFLFPVPRRRCL
jgi:hypothetical protein